MRWAFLVVAILGVVAVAAVAVELKHRNDQEDKQNCLAQVELEYAKGSTAAQGGEGQANKYLEALGAEPEEPVREAAIEAC